MKVMVRAVTAHHVLERAGWNGAPALQQHARRPPQRTLGRPAGRSPSLGLARARRASGRAESRTNRARDARSYTMMHAMPVGGGRVLTVREALKSLSVGPALHTPARSNSVHATDQQRSVASAPLR